MSGTSNKSWVEMSYSLLKNEISAQQRLGKKHFEYVRMRRYFERMFNYSSIEVQYADEVRYEAETHSVYIKTVKSVDSNKYGSITLESLRGTLEAFNNFFQLNSITGKQEALLIYFILEDGQSFGEAYWAHRVSELETESKLKDWGACHVNHAHKEEQASFEEEFLDVGSKGHMSLLMESLSDLEMKRYDYHHNYGEHLSVEKEELFRESYTDLLIGVRLDGDYTTVAEMLSRAFLYQEMGGLKEGRLTLDSFRYEPEKSRLYIKRDDMDEFLSTDRSFDPILLSQKIKAAHLVEEKKFVDLLKMMAENCNKIWLNCHFDNEEI